MNKKAETAFIWIINILQKNNIPFQIAGGLAAIAYGATRSLEDIDIDIPEDKFDLVKTETENFITYGPEQFKDESFDLLLMTINYHGQLIDLCGAFQVKIYNKNTNEWKNLSANFRTAEIKNIFGIDVPVIAKSELIDYKKSIGRPVDLIDIEQMSNK